VEKLEKPLKTPEKSSTGPVEKFWSNFASFPPQSRGKKLSTAFLSTGV
jgi:hypothetical protein